MNLYLGDLDPQGATVRLGDQALDVPAALRDERVSGPYRGKHGRRRDQAREPGRRSAPAADGGARAA